MPAPGRQEIANMPPMIPKAIPTTPTPNPAAPTKIPVVLAMAKTSTMTPQIMCNSGRRYRKGGKAFWSLGHHETCGEAPCQEYDFIGSPPFKKKLTYRAMREDFLSFLEQNGHARVKRYPIVARWRDDVFFVQASVYPFQPWVISRQASPPRSEEHTSELQS